MPQFRTSRGAVFPEMIAFREVQRFRQWWLWLIILAVPGVCLYGIIQQIVFDRPFGNDPLSDGGLLTVAGVFGGGLPLLFYAVNLTVEVRPNGLHLRYFPFHLRFHRIAFDTITRAEARTYSALREFGGWGIRWGKEGKAYTVSGDRGVQLEFRNGRKLLIGSKRAEELAQALEKALKENARPER